MENEKRWGTLSAGRRLRKKIVAAVGSQTESWNRKQMITESNGQGNSNKVCGLQTFTLDQYCFLVFDSTTTNGLNHMLTLGELGEEGVDVRKLPDASIRATYFYSYKTSSIEINACIWGSKDSKGAGRKSRTQEGNTLAEQTHHPPSSSRLVCRPPPRERNWRQKQPVGNSFERSMITALMIYWSRGIRSDSLTQKLKGAIQKPGLAVQWLIRMDSHTCTRQI